MKTKNEFLRCPKSLEKLLMEIFLSYFILCTIYLLVNKQYFGNHETSFNENFNSAFENLSSHYQNNYLTTNYFIVT
ncbi:hypothetical protein PUN28_018109 [Cardiocondyla obscurior]|uniref:Uncharacterized protein n=1 Tax=Cardiocondyla obscurior TaxID=286306 RepID=A0AAW2EJP3_9HYME